jgi:hypothetical protein
MSDVARFFWEFATSLSVFSDFSKDAYLSLKMLQTHGIFVEIFFIFI